MSKKTKRTLIALGVAIVMLLGVILSALLTDGFTEGNKYCIFGHNYDETGICTRCGVEKLDEIKPDDDSNNDAAVRGGAMLTVPEGQSGNVEVEITPVAASADVPTAIAANSWTITVTKVEPSSADNQTFDWSIRWKNADSAWATGKKVEEYCTITPDSDGAKQATMHNLKDFGEQIEIVVTSRDKPELSKIVLIDYVQKITGFTFNMPDVSSETTRFTYQVETTAYTIKSDIILSFSNTLTLSSEFKNGVYEANHDLFYDAGAYELFDAILSANTSQNIITISHGDNNGFNDWARNPLTGLVSVFMLVDEELVIGMGYSLGECTAAFRQAAISVSGAHATFGITYKASYNGQEYSTGTKTIEVRFDGNALHVPVEDFTLSTDHIII